MMKCVAVIASLLILCEHFIPFPSFIAPVCRGERVPPVQTVGIQGLRVQLGRHPSRRRQPRGLGTRVRPQPRRGDRAVPRRPGPPGRPRTLSVPHSKTSLYGAFVWARRALSTQKMAVPGSWILASLAKKRRWFISQLAGFPISAEHCAAYLLTARKKKKKISFFLSCSCAPCVRTLAPSAVRHTPARRCGAC